MKPAPHRTFRFRAFEAVVRQIDEIASHVETPRSTARVTAGMIFALAVARDHPDVANRILEDIEGVSGPGWELDRMIAALVVADGIDIGAAATVDKLRPKGHDSGVN
jgi:hypothetical protein